MSTPDVNIPDSYTHTLAGGLDLDLDEIRIKELPKIELASVSTLNGNSTVDLGLDNIHIKELPKIDLGIEFSMKPTRVHLPVNMRLGLSALGMELLAFNVCGESMVVVEDYVPHRTEICR